jgi:tRNA uridine 5-carbamoylmethylation protein Kti12
MGIIVSAFPGCGKTTMFNELNGKIKIMDSDSSKFDKNHFPKNYIDHIKENVDNVDILFVSSHKEVRDALNYEGIDFDLFYPDQSRKNEFLINYVGRKSPRDLIMKINSEWNDWINEIESEHLEHCHKHKLLDGQFLSNNDLLNRYIETLKNE